MSMAALQSLDPSAQPGHIVIDDCQGLLRIGSRQVGRRDHVARVLREQSQPIIKTPFVQQRRLSDEKVFHLPFQ